MFRNRLYLVMYSFKSLKLHNEYPNRRIIEIAKKLSSFLFLQQQPVVRASGLPGQTSVDIESGVRLIPAQDLPPPYYQVSPH